MRIEDLETEIEKKEDKAEAEQQKEGIFGKMAEVINQARYKRQVEEMKETVRE